VKSIKKIEFQDFKISRFQDFKISRFQDFKISRFQDFKISNNNSTIVRIFLGFEFRQLVKTPMVVTERPRLY